MPVVWERKINGLKFRVDMLTYRLDCVLVGGIIVLYIYDWLFCLQDQYSQKFVETVKHQTTNYLRYIPTHEHNELIIVYWSCWINMRLQEAPLYNKCWYIIWCLCVSNEVSSGHSQHSELIHAVRSICFYSAVSCLAIRLPCFNKLFWVEYVQRSLLMILFFLVFLPISKVIKVYRLTNNSALLNKSSQNYRTSLVIWDHTVLRVTQHKWTHHALTPARHGNVTNHLGQLSLAYLWGM